MKKITSVLLCLVLCFSVLSVGAFAEEPQDILLSHSVETLPNGDQIVTELYQSAVQPYTGITGYKTATYENASGVAIWSVTVTGTFDYTYGVTCSPTSASATVTLYSTKAYFISKNAYCSGRKAIATGTVGYNLVSTTLEVSVGCTNLGQLY